MMCVKILSADSVRGQVHISALRLGGRKCSCRCTAAQRKRVPLGWHRAGMG